MRTVTRGGRYLRVADPTWADPLDAGYAARDGGRWNSPASFPTLHLCRTRAVARSNVNRLLAGEPYGPEDLNPAAAPVLLDVDVEDGDRVDAVTDEGCEAVGLPRSYPLDEAGKRIGSERCQPIGRAAWDADLAGVAARSPWAEGEELAHFLRAGSRSRPAIVARHRFPDWFWP